MAESKGSKSSGKTRARRAEPQLRSSKRVSEFARRDFARLRERVFEGGEDFAVVAAMAPHEIFECFDMPFVTNEWWTSIVAGKQQSTYYLDWLEAHGFHQGLCGYSSLSLATLLDDANPDPPWGGLPKPRLLSSVSGEGSEQMFEVVASRLNIPYVNLPVPASRRFYPRWWEMSTRSWEDLYEVERVDPMTENLWHLVGVLEEITGKAYDEGKLRAICALANEQQEYFREARELICQAEKVPVTFVEQLNNVLIPQWNRGTNWATDHARQFRDEIKERVDAGIAAYPEEQIRMMWIGPGLWSDRDIYDEFVESHGAVMVRGMYMSIAADGYLKYGLSDPLRPLAARYLNLGDQMHRAPWGNEWAVHEANTHRVDAAIIILPESCEGLNVGTTMMVQSLEKAGVPVLGLRTDPVDARGYDRETTIRTISKFLDERVVPIAPRIPPK